MDSLLDPEEAGAGTRVDKSKQIEVLIQENSRLVKVRLTTTHKPVCRAASPATPRSFCAKLGVMATAHRTRRMGRLHSEEVRMPAARPHRLHRPQAMCQLVVRRQCRSCTLCAGSHVGPRPQCLHSSRAVRW